MAFNMWISHFSQSPIPQRQKTRNHYLLQVVVSRYAPLERLESGDRPLLRVLGKWERPTSVGEQEAAYRGLGGSSSLTLLLAPLAFFFLFLT